MKIVMGNRAKDKGILNIESLIERETDNYIVCVLYEKRKKDGEVLEWVDPTIVFKTPIKAGDYDQAYKLAEEAGIILMLPELKNFKTDHHGVTFNGYNILLKSWGYMSNHVSLTRRWSRETIKQNAETWIDDTELIAKTIFQMLKIIKTEIDKNRMISVAKEWLEQNNIA